MRCPLDYGVWSIKAAVGPVGDLQLQQACTTSQSGKSLRNSSDTGGCAPRPFYSSASSHRKL
ncbi:hypothetical protein Fuma_02221 [Fuerstiella marisgermanici]|uniref:Uncharacterized protein n=1 Tax=Fuerstiella marisgermanici TaxID=1891926 RepID=A0A1P8WEZ1_9PLAN|nr:hypothetical protein Fuma_02221 [Fuerstiella marisgermanici]